MQKQRKNDDKYGCFGTNHYSVPDEQCGRMVEVKMYSNILKMYYAHGLICSHDRSYEKNKWFINLDHYLKTLNRKPGALHFTHKAYIVNMNGKSFRVKETRQMMEK